MSKENEAIALMRASVDPPVGLSRRSDGRDDRLRPVLGVLLQDLLGMYGEQWLGVTDAAHNRECDLISFFGRQVGERGYRRHANAIYDLVSGQTLDGLIVWSIALGQHVGPKGIVEFCRRFQGLPIVAVEQSVGRAPVVVMAERRGMDEAVSHLIEVHGHRRIAFVRGNRYHPGARRRFHGYLDALGRHGLPVSPELQSRLLSHPGLVPDAVTRLLGGAAPPDAIATAHDDFAVEILSTLSAAGVRTPDEMPVVGFDDRFDLFSGDLLDCASIPDDPYLDARSWSAGRLDLVNSVSLTTVRAPFYELGRCAVDLLLALIRGETVPRVVEVPTELIIGRSCGCLPAAPPDVSGAFRSDAAMRERHYAHRLREALSIRSGSLPDDWAERLCRAFLRGAWDGNAGDFRNLLDQLMRQSLWSGERVDCWWRVLSTLRESVAGLDAAQNARAQELLRYAEILLTSTAQRYWRYGWVLGEKRNEIVRELGQQLISAANIAELANVMTRDLSKLGIPGCYVAAYEPSAPTNAEATPGHDVDRSWSRLLMAYEEGATVHVAAGAQVFESSRLVPGEQLCRRSPLSLVATPLYFKDQQLGFALFELGPRLGWIYVTLQEQLSTALHRMFLLESERAALAAVEEAHRRAERHRLAGELHDSVSQALFSMTLHTRAMELALQREGGDPEGRVARGLGELRTLTQSALAEMRALIFQMRPDALHEEGLVAALRRHAAAVAARDGVDVRVHAPDDRLPLSERVEEELLRVVQEALHNSVKHAHPGRVEIRFVPLDRAGALAVEVTDDGVGFDPDVRRPGHLGLDIMRERVEGIGGQFFIDSSLVTSTTVRAVLPGALREPPATDDTRTP